MRSAGPAEFQSVDELSATIKDTLTQHPRLASFSVRGELQGFKVHSSGHVYFTLLGAESRISAVLFRSYAASLLKWPSDGDEVIVLGRIDVYPPRGTYQIYATRLLPLGGGAQARAKEDLRRALEREGVFDPRNKRPLPAYPSRVAVVTSPTGAALQDVLKVASLRAPSVDVIVVPTLVQGIEAPAEIAAALSRCAGIDGLSCVMLVRGGGSRDDLTPFDDEMVVRAVRSSPIPVVTGVGHQIDLTLSDLAADAHAPTPSAAAERLLPDSRSLLRSLAGVERIITGDMYNALGRAEVVASRAFERSARAIGDRVAALDERVSFAAGSVSSLAKELVTAREAKLRALAASIDALSPLAVFGRGYVVCRDASGEPVRSAASLSKGDEVGLRFADGTAKAKITGIKITEYTK